MKFSITLSYEDATKVMDSLNGFGSSVDWKLTDEQSSAYNEFCDCIDSMFMLSGRESTAQIILDSAAAKVIRGMVNDAAC